MRLQARPFGVVRAPVAAAVAATLSVGLLACVTAPSPSPETELVAIPTQTPRGLVDLGPHACPQALLEGVLVRDDGAGLAVQQADPRFPPVIVVWPYGWVAADVDGVRVVIDDSGHTVGREGDRFSAGGGSAAPNDWFHPCGPISLTPAP